ncbi:MAG TPA: glycosyltransferase family 1 protein [Fibrobacteria bacterium]|nr:glycosyltransferase family 1 protein [Fibrobacteria bacterium]
MRRPLLLVEALATRNDSGLGNMARLFVEGLRGLADAADIRVLVPRAGAYRPGPHCQAIPVEPRPVRLWTETAFPWLIRELGPTAVFCLGQNLPRWRPAARYALAVPDAGPLEDLGWPTSSHDPRNRARLKRMVPQADAVLTISEFTKARLARLLPIPRDRIRVVLPIPPADRRRAEAREASVPAAGNHPPGEYFLALGNVEPRKNFPGLIAAYAVLKNRRPDAPPLYIAGHKAWGYAETLAAVARHGLADSVHLTGYLSDADAKAHLAHCRVFVSSSLYEGWGLPLFEALSLGKPAIYHEGSSQAEFARGCALAVDCRDAEGLAGAMETLWRDGAERERLRASAAGLFPKILAYDLEGALRAALLPLLQ